MALHKTNEALHNRCVEEVRSTLQAEYRILEQVHREMLPIQLAYDSNIPPGDRGISASLAENERIIAQVFHLPLNQDVLIRHFEIPDSPCIKAMLVFLEGLSDKEAIRSTILKPLMLCSEEGKVIKQGGLLNSLIEGRLPNGQARRIANFRDAQEGINDGDAVLFIDGELEAIVIQTEGRDHRNIDRPTLEQTVSSSQEAFTEKLNVNTSLIRAALRSSDLVTETVSIGTRGRVKCAFLYVQSIANPRLVAEIRRRINGISTSFVSDIGVLMQFIDDHPNVPLPTTLATERPDRVAAHLNEGRVAILMDGSPFAHVVPISFFTLFHSPEDFSLKLPEGAFMRIVRLVGAMIALLLPAIYLAIVTFHQEALPTDLALTIAGAREQVPFPVVAEILLMELAFELIREGGLRVPGMMGTTIGIVGALILGQAAVAAGVVSPIMIIIIATTGLANFTIPDYRLAFSIRLFRFVFVLLAAFFGLVGITCGMLLLTVILCSLKSFGLPYMTPIGPKTLVGLDVVYRGVVYRQELRPDGLNPQDIMRQPSTSRRWEKDDPIGGEQK